MTSRTTSLVLASFFALLFALAAQAGELSMDVGSLHASAESSPCSSNTDLDESVATASDRVSAEASPGRDAQWPTSVTTSSQRRLVHDTETGSANPGSATGSSANAISAQVKPRNRWQSIVPGAIK
jgi:hypothetical protein